ncbi:MAG: glutathione S-transferase [Stappiaceae bacterium]
MGATQKPILYSFRRCPYAIRARLALHVSELVCELREIILRNKPAHMLEISPKGTVPVLQLPEGPVLEESLDIMLWALGQNDPERWLMPETGTPDQMHTLIDQCEFPFKNHLDHYKYANRFEGADPLEHRQKGVEFLAELDARLALSENLFGNRECLADHAIYPFVRQFANTDRQWFDAFPLPNLKAWLQGHTTSERFQAAFLKWPVWVDGDAVTHFPTNSDNAG